ncbi:uncharacterized protein PG998_008886 [Apiospora kogelbergensis]|uniref:uncharacterized protein n=1 Tax=Apiospora kogelbergensis TaxID=1337665 RepID=UPI00312D8E77
MVDLTGEQQLSGYGNTIGIFPSKRIKTRHDAGPCLSSDEETSAQNRNNHGSAGQRMNVLTDVLEYEIVDKDTVDVLSGNNRKPPLDPIEVIAHEQHELYDCPETRTPGSGESFLLDKQLMKEDLQGLRGKLYDVEAELQMIMECLPSSPPLHPTALMMPPSPSVSPRQREAQRRNQLLQHRALLQLDIQSGEDWLQYIANVDGGCVVAAGAADLPSNREVEGVELGAEQDMLCDASAAETMPWVAEMVQTARAYNEGMVETLQMDLGLGDDHVAVYGPGNEVERYYERRIW